MGNPEEYHRIRKARAPHASRTPEAWANAYGSLRRALGFDTTEVRKVFRSLLRFMRDRGFTSFSQFDHDSAVAWLRYGNIQEMSAVVRLATIRGFFRYLVSVGVLEDNIWNSLSHPRPKRFVPYIFSLAELRNILEQTLQMLHSRKHRGQHVERAYHVAYHTAYACGLRAGEVCRLRIRDVDFERSLFQILNTKFGKSRLVPFNKRTRELVSAYLHKHRPTDVDASPDAPLFVNYWRRPFTRGRFTTHFAQVCAAIGIYQPKKIEGKTVYGGTTPHALRHSFAVHRLLKWYEDGADVNSKLPLLATYMGHSKYRFTQKYLRVLPEFIKIANRLFSGRFEEPLRDLEG